MDVSGFNFLVKLNTLVSHFACLSHLIFALFLLILKHIVRQIALG